MKNLINYLLEFGALDAAQIDLIKSRVSVVTLKKDDYFFRAGNIPDRVAFIDQGILRAFRYDEKGAEITLYFSDEKNFAVDINCFNQKIPSTQYIRAVIDCRLLVLSRESIAVLSSKIPVWDTIVAEITARGMNEKIEKLSPMLSQDAKTRYLEFLKKFPNLANRVPLVYLASFLGMTKSSLSRIRRTI